MFLCYIGRHLDRVVRVLAHGAEGSGFRTHLVLGISQKNSLAAQKGMGTRLPSKLGKVKAERKRNGASPPLRRYQPTPYFSTHPLANYSTIHSVW